MVDFNQFLDFEKPVVDVEQELIKLRAEVEAGNLAKVPDVEKLKRKLDKVRNDVYGNLKPYQRVRLSRHFERPQTLDYVRFLITDFTELHGDRLFGDDKAIIGGLGKFNSRPVVVIGHQRGHDTQARIERNFGMAQPEGNRKGQRLMKLAEKFKLPLLLFIDTQGAYPGMEAEERGQAESIARNLYVLAGLKTPIISTVIGEGGSGGALAFGICDRLLMLENSIYSVITPEGCASILWGKSAADKVAEYAKDAAAALQVDAASLARHGIADEVIAEPAGGAHRNPASAAEALGLSIAKHLNELSELSVKELMDFRYQKFRKIGAF